MILLLMLGVALALTAPLLFALRRPRALRNRREAALALHRAQLGELVRDRDEGRIGATEYHAAKLEVERRLLAADGAKTPELNGDARLLLTATIVALPFAAFALYLPGSTPRVPSEPHAQWAAQQEVQQARMNQVIALLRGHLASIDPNSVDASQGQAYLAEALAEQAGTITPEALALFQQSLAHAPAEASWRALDEQRIAQAQGGSP
jgi:cytochrome c-type biogenesis protein CcmH